MRRSADERTPKRKKEKHDKKGVPQTPKLLLIVTDRTLDNSPTPVPTTGSKQHLASVGERQ